MPRIRQILFPVDFSASCRGAARYVEFFAGRFQAEVTLLHVVEMGEHNLAEELLPGRQSQMDIFLAGKPKYFTTKRLCVPGDPAAEIVELARTLNPDLIMLPTHGMGPFRRLLLGSVTAKVLHDWQGPVWTGLHAETAPSLEKIHGRKVLCAIDLAARSENVLGYAAWLARESQAELGIVHTTSALPSTYRGLSMYEDMLQTMVDRPRQSVEALQSISGSSGRVFVKSGTAAAVVAEVATEFGADLLVMGRHGGGGQRIPAPNGLQYPARFRLPGDQHIAGHYALSDWNCHCRNCCDLTRIDLFAQQTVARALLVGLFLPAVMTGGIAADLRHCYDSPIFPGWPAIRKLHHSRLTGTGGNN